MSINSDAADILESAAFVIGTGHHAKNYVAVNARKKECETFSDNACAWCALGAIEAASDALVTDYNARHLAKGALYLAIGSNSIALWNDAPERTPAEVEAAMLKAAAKLRGEA